MDEAEKRAQIRILVADDQVEARGVIQSVLSSLGYVNVYQATTGFDAVDVAVKRQVHLIICDWNMPGADGLEVLQTLRKHPDHKKTPFLMLTSESYRENVRKAFKAGVTSYLIKPITPKSFIAELEKVASGIDIGAV
jgi:two-component system chemotaxis response regulator CheY